MMVAERIGKNIKREFEKTGLSMREFSARCEHSDTAVRRWVYGLGIPNAYGLYLVSKVCGCTMESLMEGVEDE